MVGVLSKTVARAERTMTCGLFQIPRRSRVTSSSLGPGPKASLALGLEYPGSTADLGDYASAKFALVATVMGAAIRLLSFLTVLSPFVSYLLRTKLQL